MGSEKDPRGERRWARERSERSLPGKIKGRLKKEKDISRSTGESSRKVLLITAGLANLSPTKGACWHDSTAEAAL